MSTLEVVIVGGGPSGLAVAIECARRGLSHLVIEKGSLVDSIRRFPLNMVFFTTPELLEIGDLPLVTSREKPVRLEALKYYRKVAQHYRLPLQLYEKVVQVTREDSFFHLLSSPRAGPPRTYRAGKVIVATGYFDNPNLIGIPGEDSPKVSHYYTEAHPYFGQEVAVIGAANSAAEAALDLFRSGARVTLIHRRRELSPHLKYWVRPDIENRISRGEIPAFFETEVEEILPGRLRLKTSGGSRLETPNDFVLALTGYQPDYRFLAAMGIRIDGESGRPEHDPESLETNVPGLYIAGALASGRETNKIFIENGRFHGAKIVEHLVSRL